MMMAIKYHVQLLDFRTLEGTSEGYIRTYFSTVHMSISGYVNILNMMKI